MRTGGVSTSLVSAALVLASATALAQPPGRGPVAAPSADLAIDACGVATKDQFRFLIAAGLGRSLPVTRTSDGERVVISSPTITAVTCAPLHVELQAQVTRLPATGPAGDSTVALAHVTAVLLAKASFHSDSAKSARIASALSSATLCVRSVDVVRVDARAGLSLDKTRLRAWLTEALRDQCFDITSLVYVFLERGGTLSPLR